MSRARTTRPRVGLRISVESTDGIHRGKITGFHGGEAAIKWDGGFEAYIDVLDLLRPDGSPFDDYDIAQQSGDSK